MNFRFERPVRRSAALLCFLIGLRDWRGQLFSSSLRSTCVAESFVLYWRPAHGKWLVGFWSYPGMQQEIQAPKHGTAGTVILRYLEMQEEFQAAAGNAGTAGTVGLS